MGAGNSSGSRAHLCDECLATLEELGDSVDEVHTFHMEEAAANMGESLERWVDGIFDSQDEGWLKVLDFWHDDDGSHFCTVAFLKRVKTTTETEETDQ